MWAQANGKGQPAKRPVGENNGRWRRLSANARSLKKKGRERERIREMRINKAKVALALASERKSMRSKRSF